MSIPLYLVTFLGAVVGYLLIGLALFHWVMSRVTLQTYWTGTEITAIRVTAVKLPFACAGELAEASFQAAS